jgi:hypothetical protein
MKVYISGPMTGIREFNHPAFNTMQAALESVGLKAVNPACLNPQGDGDAHWRKCVVVDVIALLDCDAIINLPGWHHSRGAILEMVIARFLRMKYLKFVEGETKFGFVEGTWPTALLIRALVDKLKSM